MARFANRRVGRRRDSLRRLGRVLALAPAATLEWALLGPLGLVVRLALFRKYRSQGTTSLLWGFAFAVFLWAGLRAVSLSQGRAIAFALIAGAASGLFVYLRGAALENPPAARPGVFLEGLIARRRSRRAARTPAANF